MSAAMGAGTCAFRFGATAAPGTPPGSIYGRSPRAFGPAGSS